MSQVVLLGRTYNDAHLAQLRYAGQIEALAEARMASTFAVRVLDGSPASRVYVAPRTGDTSRPVNYRYAVLMLARSLRKTPGADPVVRQILEDGTTEPIDLDAMTAAAAFD